MNTKDLLKKLEEHLRKVEAQASELYKIRLKSTIYKLKSGNYPDYELIADLKAVGFNDLATKVQGRITNGL